MKSCWISGVILTVIFSLNVSSFAQAEFRAGAAVVDVTPTQFPVFVNGGMTSRSASEVTTPVNARAIVLDDGNERLAIVIVDSCMMPRPLLDDAKALAATKTKIKPDRMLIAATHTHTAPASMSCLGTDADPNYVPFLRLKLAEAIQQAEANLEPARVGFAVTQAPEHTALRRWIRRPDRIAEDPFGNPTVRANMHAGRNWDDVTGESGPEDPDLTLIAIQSRSGRPLAVLANFSMHYFSGQKALAADYFGLFSEGLKVRLANGSDGQAPPFVGIMSHGCSGDIWRKDYKNAEPTEIESGTIEHYTEGLLDFAVAAYQSIEYQSEADLAMAEARMTFNYRVPNKQLLEWSERIVEEMGDRLPKTTAEVYAREQLILHERQSTEIVVQALRIGDIGIATTPNETYALTGLKIKLNSPLEKTMVIELANGGDGYIPPPEQHLLGGYNTWPARSAGLDVMAEPKIAETGLRLLEQVAGSPRRPYRQSKGTAAEKILNAQPIAYWRMDELAGPRAVDSSPHHRDAIYEPAVAFFLEGPRSKDYCLQGESNRSAHFAGGRLSARVPELQENYTVSFWIWNGMPIDARPVSGWIFSRDRNHGTTPRGDHLGVGGVDNHPGKLIFQHGQQQPVAGTTDIARWTWHHVALVRTAENVTVYLNGTQEFQTTADGAVPPHFDELFFGGRSDNDSNWEGRLDEIAVFDRAFSADDISSLLP